MILNELFKPKKTIVEGGNVSSQSPGWQGMPGDHKAEEIDLKLHDRDFMVGQIRELLKAQNESFSATYGRPIWDPKILDSNQMFSGSSLTFFDVKSVSTQDFLNKLQKTKVGDIDTQVDQAIGDELTAWLKSVVGKKIGNGTFVGFNSSLSALWKLQDPPVKIQIDYELGPYQAAQGKEPARPTEWFAYSHSSDLADMEQGIKGVFHKYINRALTHAQESTKYVARVLKKGVKINPEPTTDSDYSFAVAGGQGGGLSLKYKPYIDPETGQPMEQDGIPVMQLLEPAQRDYIQNLDQQFQHFYGRKRTAKDIKLQNSFVGTIQLMNGALNPEQNESVARAFLEILFGQGAQMITAGDPIRDRDTKFAAIDWMIEHLKLPNAKTLRQETVQMAMAYEAKFNDRQKAKAPVAESVNEAEVKSQLRKGMPHLHDLKPADFLDLLDELHDGNGNFKLQNIPLNVKVDGFGGRFGKNADGKPFMGTSRTEPRYQAGFLDYHQKKGTTDPEILGRAKKFDDLFYEMMNAVKMVDSKLGAEFLVNKQVTCEVLFLPFAIPQDDGRLKYVGIAYDELPKGVQLALVPFRIVDATTGEDLPDADSIVKELTGLGQQGSVMFIDNSLTQNEALDVTAIVPPLDNIEALKKIVSDTAGKRDRASLELRRQVESELLPIKERLEAAIIKDPNIVGKDMLGKDYEGIVINSRLGPIKVTSQEQRNVIQAKNDAKTNARTERPRGEAKTAVVAIGSFVGHIGHEQLFDYTVKKAKQLGGDPYLFIGNAEGKDDPIPPAVKVQTWHKMYPQYADNISTVTQQGGTLMQKIKHELINPLPGKPPRYDNIIIMVGEDQANMPIANALMKAVNKFQGYEHVKVSLEVTPRGTGMSFTKLRNILKDPNATPEQQYAVWAQGFDEKKLGKDWILHLMDLTRKGMGIQQQKQQPAMVPERLFNALINPRLNELDEKPKKSWADYGMADDEPKEKKAKVFHGWQDYEEANKKKQQPAPNKDVDETARMSAAVKLQRAWEREQAKSTASRKRGEEVMAQAKKDAEKKQQGVAEGFTPNKGDEVYYRNRLVGWFVGYGNNDKVIVEPNEDEGHDSNNPIYIDKSAVTIKPNQQGVAEGSGKNVVKSVKVGNFRHDLVNTGMGWQVRIYNGDELYDTGLSKNSEEKGLAALDNSVAYTKKQLNIKEQGVAEGAPELLKKEMPTHRHAEKLLAQNGVSKDDPDYHHHLSNTIKHLRQFGNIDLINKSDEQGVAEAMLPKSAFAGSNKNKLGSAGQWKNTGPSKNRPARQGDLVGGGAEESIEQEAKQRLDPHCWKGYRKAGTKMKGSKRVNNCVPVSEDIENVMANLITLLENK